MNVRLIHHNGEPWIIVEAPSATTGSEPICIYEGPIPLTSKRVIRDEIDWVNSKTGVDRPTLYDAIRDYKHASRPGMAGRVPAGRGLAPQGSPAQAPSATQSVHNQSPNLRGRKER